MISSLPVSILLSVASVLLASGPAVATGPRVDIHLHDGKLDDKMNIVISGRRDFPHEQHLVYSGVTDPLKAHRDNLDFFDDIDEQKIGEGVQNHSNFHTPKRYFYAGAGTPFSEPAPHEENFAKPRSHVKMQPLMDLDQLASMIARWRKPDVYIKQTAPTQRAIVETILQNLAHRKINVSSFHLNPGYNSRQDDGRKGQVSEKTYRYPEELGGMVRQGHTGDAHFTNNYVHFGGPRGGMLPYHELIGRIPTRHLEQSGPKDPFVLRQLNNSKARLTEMFKKEKKEPSQYIMEYLNDRNHPVTQEDIWKARYNFPEGDEQTETIRERLLQAIRYNQQYFDKDDVMYKRLAAVKSGLNKCTAEACDHNHDSIVALARSKGTAAFMPVIFDRNFHLEKAEDGNYHALAPVPIPMKEGNKQGDAEYHHVLEEMKKYLPLYGPRLRESRGYEGAYATPDGSSYYHQNPSSQGGDPSSHGGGDSSYGDSSSHGGHPSYGGPPSYGGDSSYGGYPYHYGGGSSSH